MKGKFFIGVIAGVLLLGSYHCSLANDIVKGLVDTPVPVTEPQTILLFGIGLVGLAVQMRGGKNNK
jgi:hypothetical protein